MMILVTGGLGYIGSHTVVELLQTGNDVLVVDNLTNSSLEVLDGIERASGKRPLFECLSLNDKMDVKYLFNNYEEIEGVIHFAAFKAVGESISEPLKYYDNNIGSLVNVLQYVDRLNLEIPFIFSSSCTVYGEPDSLPITEESPTKKASSPYGNTKQIGEEILFDAVRSNSNLSVIVLRYFNPIGAHKSMEIGELPLGTPQNLVPFMTQTAMGMHKRLTVFGDDYPTRDGTCVRDYVHVVDLAKAHIVALQRLVGKKNEHNYEVFNLGSGTGKTVLEIISDFKKVSKVNLKYKMGPRRQGDVIEAYADVTKANSVLGWKAQFNVKQAIRSAWKWERKIRNKN